MRERLVTSGYVAVTDADLLFAVAVLETPLGVYWEEEGPARQAIAAERAKITARYLELKRDGAEDWLEASRQARAEWLRSWLGGDRGATAVR